MGALQCAPVTSLTGEARQAHAGAALMIGDGPQQKRRPEAVFTGRYE